MEPTNETGQVVGFPQQEHEAEAPKPRKQKRRYAIDTGLRQRVEVDGQVLGEYIAYFCTGDCNDFMAFVLEEDVRMVAGERRVTCGRCYLVHQLITIPQAMRRYVLGASSGQSCEDVIVSTDHEALLMNHLRIVERSIAREAATTQASVSAG